MANRFNVATATDAAAAGCVVPPGMPAALLTEDRALSSMDKVKPDRLVADTSDPVVARIAAARGGDEGALEDLIRQYQNRVARFVVSKIGHQDDFEDVCQIIFVKMVLSLKELKNANVFEPWLFRIARNACTDHLRRRQWRRLFVPFAPEHESVPAADPGGVETGVRAFESALQTLPGAQRELIGLLRDKDWSYEELAQITKSTVPSVKARLFRARSRLRELLAGKES